MASDFPTDCSEAEADEHVYNQCSEHSHRYIPVTVDGSTFADFAQLQYTDEEKQRSATILLWSRAGARQRRTDEKQDQIYFASLPGCYACGIPTSSYCDGCRHPYCSFCEIYMENPLCPRCDESKYPGYVWLPHQQNQCHDSAQQIERLENQCVVCNGRRSVRCGNCKATPYCGPVCAKADQKAHAEICSSQRKFTVGAKCEIGVNLEHKSSLSMIHYCFHCKKQASLRCGACRVARYCSRACQKQDWKKHKRVCRLKATRV
jgi:hypothetical protein